MRAVAFVPPRPPLPRVLLSFLLCVPASSFPLVHQRMETTFSLSINLALGKTKSGQLCARVRSISCPDPISVVTQSGHSSSPQKPDRAALATSSIVLRASNISSSRRITRPTV